VNSLLLLRAALGHALPLKGSAVGGERMGRRRFQKDIMRLTRYKEEEKQATQKKTKEPGKGGLTSCGH